MNSSRQKLVAVFLLLSLVSLISIKASAQPMLGADIAFKSKYIWRGMPFHPEAVFWPDAWVNYSGFTVTLFGSLEMTDINDQRNTFTNVVYYLDYTHALGKVTGIIGYAHYTYPNTEIETTGEIYAGVSGDLKYVSASLRGYFDVIDAKGMYLNPCLSRSIPIENLPTEFILALGYGDSKHNAYYFVVDTVGVDEAAVTDLTATLKFAYTPPGKLGEFLSLGWDFNYSFIVDSKLAKAYKDDSNYWFGFSLNFSRALGGE